MLGPEGGTLSHPAGAVLVPPGALAAPVSLSITATQAPSAEELGATPLGPAFLLGPEGQGFARPVQLTLPFEPARVPEGAGASLGVGGQADLGTVALPTQVSSSTEALITVDANLLVNPGTFPLTFINPAPGGGTSAPLPFRVVTLAPPTLLAPTPSGFPNHITQGHLTVDDVSVYWTDSAAGKASMVPIAGGPVIELDSVDPATGMSGISVGRCNVYWLRSGNLLFNRTGELMSVPVARHRELVLPGRGHPAHEQGWQRSHLAGGQPE